MPFEMTGDLPSLQSVSFDSHAFGYVNAIVFRGSDETPVFCRFTGIGDGAVYVWGVTGGRGGEREFGCFGE